jgi:phosphatidate cytidylyltransferase
MANKIGTIIKESSTRIITGIALLIVAVGVGYIDTFLVMWILFGGLTLVGIKEAMTLYKHFNNHIYYYASAIWIVAYFYPKPEDLIFVVAVVFASILAYTKEFDKNLFLPLFYPTASFLFLLSLYISFGMSSLLWLLVIVASTDIGAYFTGKSIGKTKFCQTSPNKTLEGVVGGVIVATVLGTFFAIDSIGIYFAIIISAIVAISSIFGDLFESYLKREANVKDSGDILPGHGGILDRMDGYLFGGIIMLVLLRLLG